MSYILCIETSSTNCSVALATLLPSNFKNDYGISHCLDVHEDQSASYSHGENLHVFIEHMLKKNKLTARDICAVAVSAGPGSYTGLRIGISSAKGFCYALDIPLIAIPTLQAVSVLNTTGSEVTIPMLDARRMEVYAAVYNGTTLLEEVKPVVLDDQSFSTYKSNTVTYIGTGTTKFKELVGETSTQQFIEMQPTALTLCDLAVSKYKISDTVDVAYFEPLYLKEFKIS